MIYVCCICVYVIYLYMHAGEWLWCVYLCVYDIFVAFVCVYMVRVWSCMSACGYISCVCVLFASGVVRICMWGVECSVLV